MMSVAEEPPAAPAAEEQKPEAAETPPAATEEKPPEEKKPEETKTEEKPADEGEKKEEKPPEDQKKEDTPPAAPATPSTDATAAVKPPAPPPVENAAVAQSPKPKQAEESLQLARKPSNLNSAVSLFNHHRGSTTFDLVDRMPFLYVRVVKAKRSEKDSDDSTMYYAKLAIGTHSINIKAQGTSKDWDQVFAFDKEGLNSTSLDVSVFDQKKKVVEEGKEEVLESCLGTVTFDLPEVPKRVPPSRSVDELGFLVVVRSDGFQVVNKSVVPGAGCSQ